MSLPQRIRGPRARSARIAGGYDVEPIVTREPKVSRRSVAHCDFVRDHDCIVPGCKRRPIEVAHVRYGTGGGMGQKPSDRWTVSLCGMDLDGEGHHREQHRIGELAFERKYGIDLKAKALEFVAASPRRRELEVML